MNKSVRKRDLMLGQFSHKAGSGSVKSPPKRAYAGHWEGEEAPDPMSVDQKRKARHLAGLSVDGAKSLWLSHGAGVV